MGTQSKQLTTDNENNDRLLLSKSTIRDMPVGEFIMEIFADF